jgi:hypothetical protein
LETESPRRVAVSRRIAGRLPSGAEIIECRLANERGTEAAILPLGATLRSLTVSDALGLETHTIRRANAAITDNSPG